MAKQPAKSPRSSAPSSTCSSTVTCPRSSTRWNATTTASALFWKSRSTSASHRAHHRDGRHRGPRARRGSDRHRRPDHRARGQCDARPDPQRRGRARGRRRPRRGRRKARHPPARPRLRRTVDGIRNPRDRHQGGRPARPLLQGRQDRPLRRCRRGQDGSHHGTDQQHRQGALGLLGLRRCGRADPRGQRPLPRDDRIQRDQARQPV
jgi:hypothetical protein